MCVRVLCGWEKTVVEPHMQRALIVAMEHCVRNCFAKLAALLPSKHIRDVTVSCSSYCSSARALMFYWNGRL